jgi:hypothetical protein
VIEIPTLLATDGSLVTALPFAGPAILVSLGMLGLTARDRLRRRRRSRS